MIGTQTHREREGMKKELPPAAAAGPSRRLGAPLCPFAGGSRLGGFDRYTTMVEYVIGKHGEDMAWLRHDGSDWTPNIFGALRLPGNDAVKMVHTLKGGGVRAYTEEMGLALNRYQAFMSEAPDEAGASNAKVRV